MVLDGAARAVGGPLHHHRAPLVRDLASAARGRALLAALLCAMLFVLPFRSSVALRNVLLCATIAGLAALALRGAPWRSWMPARRVLVPILLLAAWCVASTAWSVVPQATARELWPEVVAPLLAFFAF